MVYVVTAYLYFDAPSDTEAVKMRDKSKEMIDQPMVKSLLKSNGVVNPRFNVGAAVPMPDQR